MSSVAPFTSGAPAHESHIAPRRARKSVGRPRKVRGSLVRMVETDKALAILARFKWQPAHELEVFRAAMHLVYGATPGVWQR